jgi:outer membrane translocation and assembly module TamA
MAVVSSTVHASTIVTGTSESKKASEKYSLKNLSSLSQKTSTFQQLKSGLVYKGLSSQSNYLKYNKGNITYVIPYRHKVILPKFKTPSPQNP